MRADLMPIFPSTPKAAPRDWRRMARVVVTGLALSLAMPVAGFAQTAEPGADDLRALIYYLDNDDQRSVQAEMRRLRAQFPRWTPPGDVNQLRAMATTASATVDERPIWARIERQDFAGARALIDEARARTPGWSPNAEMLRVIEINESQAAFDAAYASRDAAGALAAARRTPALMRCDRINNAWQLAELYEAGGAAQNALSTYRGVVQSCTRLSDVVPTLEKANEVASLDEITALIELARQTTPSSTNALNELEDRLRAGRGQSPTGRAASSAPAAASNAAASTAAVASAPRAAAPAATSPGAPLSSAPTGLGPLPLRGDGRITRVRQMKEQGNWQACLAASASPRSLEVLYERSWCAYSLDRSGEALAGFTEVAQRGSALGGNTARDARFGMILTSLSLNMTEESARLAAATDLTQQQRLEVETTILDQRGIRAYHNREYAQSIAYFNALEQLTGSLRRDIAMLRAYAYLNNGQAQLAVDEFTRLHSELATDDTRSGLESARSALSSG
ncbi:hypothetical protein DDE20_06485 [Pararhodobacter oceanensis]|uniref:Cellulose synthase n=2 Tax=Pararhodobacter oceanensis TaxID=2172121 RepID=A0A2T8HWD0_9RHOB|nr:hypothetical protein DDE20_06485 [Pararhodobacter oceanensis]